MNIAINIYFIYIRRNRLINARRNDIAKTLSISIIFVCIVAMILNYVSSYNILYSINNYDKNQNKILFDETKRRHFSTITFIIIIDVIWLFILLLWIADFIRIKIKSDETFYNYLKKKAFKKIFIYLMMMV
jgi:ABC-type Mn2+/Zn2+ transport system permease subunit